MAPVLALLGAFLCFWGGKLVRPTLYIGGLSIGLFLGYWVGNQIDNPAAAWVLAGVGGVAAAALVIMAFSAGMFLLGAAAGGVLYHGLMVTLGKQFFLPEWGIIAAAAAGGMLSILLRKRVLAVLTAILGAYLIVEASVSMLGGHFGWAAPPGFATPVLRDAAWIVLSAAGIILQRSKRTGRGVK